MEGLGEVVDGYFRIKGYFVGHVEIAYLWGWISLCLIEGLGIDSLCTHDASWPRKVLIPIWSLIWVGTTYDSIQYLVFKMF